MTTLIRKAFISNLDSADWMDTETKEAAKEKVRFKMTQKKFAWISVMLPQNAGNLTSEDLNFEIFMTVFPNPLHSSALTGRSFLTCY